MDFPPSNNTLMRADAAIQVLTEDGISVPGSIAMPESIAISGMPIFEHTHTLSRCLMFNITLGYFLWLIHTENGFCDAEMTLSPELEIVYYWPETSVDVEAFIPCETEPFNPNADKRRKRIAPLLPEASRVCVGPRLWDEPDVTSCVDCGSLLNPEGGLVSYNATTLGAVATYTCEEGFLLMGAPMRECLANGQWSEGEPFCEGKLLVILL